MAEYKAIIIDGDSDAARELKQNDCWDALDTEIVATVSDPSDGLKAIRRYNADLVICEVWPRLGDGLTIAKTLQSEDFDCAVIVYSSHDDFEYVSAALEYGVACYLLKPSSSQVIYEKVRKVLMKLEKARESRRALDQHRMGLPLLKGDLLKKLLEGTDAGESESDLKKIGVTLPSHGIVIDCTVLGGGESEAAQTLKRAFDELMGVFENFGAVGHCYADGFVLVTEFEDVNGVYGQVRKTLDGCVAESDVKLSAGISAPYGHGLTLQQAYARAKQFQNNYLFFSVNNIVIGGEGTPAGKTDKLVSDALKIITERYAEKIAVREVAEQLFVSESHLMHRFKECLGKTFNECLTGYRMQKARQLLSESSGDRRIKEVAASVGYSDVKYFSQLFKEYFGVSPRNWAMHKSKR